MTDKGARVDGRPLCHKGYMRIKMEWVRGLVIQCVSHTPGDFDDGRLF